MIGRSTVGALGVLLAVGLSGATAGSPGPELTAEEVAYVDSLFAEWASPATPGAAVGILRAGRLVFAKGYGSAVLEHRVPIDPSTVFHVASDAKRFTALAILELEAAGALHRDDDIRRHLPELPAWSSSITIRQLLNHTSGLRDQWQLLGLSGMLPPDVVTTEHVIGLVANQQALNFSPGDQFMYCNTGYTLLAEIVSRVSGESFAQYAGRVIFAPLGMSSTRFIDRYELVVPNRAASYSTSEDEVSLDPLNYVVPGATSLLTTVEDLSRWIVHANARYGRGDPSDPYTQLLTEDTTRGGESISHGYGVATSRYRGTALLGHGGNDAGFVSYFARLPELDAGVIVLANTAAESASAKAFQLIDHFFAGNLEPVEQPQPEEPLHPSQDPEIFDQYLGTYRFEVGERLNVVKEFWWLAVGPPGTHKYDRLSPVLNEPYMFEDTSTGKRYKFSPVDAVSKAAEVEISSAGQAALSGRRHDPAGTPDQALEGVYTSPELETQWRMKFRDGHLEMSHLRGHRLEFSRIADDHYEGGTWFASRIIFRRDAHGSVCEALISARRITNVVFRNIDNCGVPSDDTTGPGHP